MEGTMEARTQARLDAQEEQIHKLTGHLASLTQQVTVLQKSQEKFQGAVFQWMKKLDKLQMMEITDREITFNDLYSFSKLVEWKSIIQSSETEGMEASKDENDNEDVDAGEEETDNNNDDSDDAEERDEGLVSVKMGDVAIINGEKKNIWRKEKPARIEQIRANIGLSDTQRTLVLEESAMITTRNAEGVLGRKRGLSSDYRNRGGGEGQRGDTNHVIGHNTIKPYDLEAQSKRKEMSPDPWPITSSSALNKARSNFPNPNLNKPCPSYRSSLSPDSTPQGCAPPYLCRFGGATVDEPVLQVQSTKYPVTPLSGYHSLRASIFESIHSIFYAFFLHKQQQIDLKGISGVSPQVASLHGLLSKTKGGCMQQRVTKVSTVEEATGEKESAFHSQHPDFSLEDKTDFKEGVMIENS